MSLSSSLNASVSGLSVNASRLAATSDNIANSGTNGYRRAVVDFASVVTGENSSGRYSAGGVRSTSSREVEAQGALLTTSNATDIAIGGSGLLAVTPIENRNDPAISRPIELLPTGSFEPDDEGFLVTPAGQQLLGFPLDAAGNLAPGVIRSSGVSLEPVQINGISFASDPSTAINLGINLPAGETAFGASGAAITTGVEYFDSLGTAQTLTFTFTPLPAAAAGPTSNQWSVQISDSAGGTPITPATLYLDFNGTGPNAGFLNSVSTVAPPAAPVAPAAALFDPATGVLNATLPVGNVAITLGALNAPGPLSQFDSTFSSVDVSTNGSPVGNLSRVEVDSFGRLEAIFDTGFREFIFQIPIADVPNPNGLTAVDNQAFSVSAESGNFFLFDAGSGPVGNLLGFTLEQSSTDLAQELTTLIETQRAYSSNATVVRTIDQVLQETTNLRG